MERFNPAGIPFWVSQPVTSCFQVERLVLRCESCDSDDHEPSGLTGDLALEFPSFGNASVFVFTS